MLQNAPNYTISRNFLVKHAPEPPQQALPGIQLAQPPKKVLPLLANPAYAHGLTKKSI